MPWTGDWSDVTGRLKADTAEQVRQALVERAPIAGVAVPASLAIPIQGTLSATTARAIDSFFNDIVDANVFFDHTANGGVFSGPGATVLSIDTQTLSRDGRRQRYSTPSARRYDFFPTKIRGRCASGFSSYTK